MKTILSGFIFLMCCSQYGQEKYNSWFKVVSKHTEGYLNYKVTKSYSSIYISLDGRYRYGNQNMVLSDVANIVSERDPLLPVKYFSTEATSDDLSKIPGKVSRYGMVSYLNDQQTWKANWTNRETITDYPTVALWNLPYILTTLEYTEKGKLLELNVIQINELDYEKENYLEYVSDEVIVLDEKEVSVRKIALRHENGQLYYWLDFENNIVQMRIDRTNLVKCARQDVPLDEFDWEVD
ncbi:MAG: hypothetical protein AAF554_01605 [Bacteroidota bacterium]